MNLRDRINHFFYGRHAVINFSTKKSFHEILQTLPIVEKRVLDKQEGLNSGLIFYLERDFDHKTLHGRYFKSTEFILPTPNPEFRGLLRDNEKGELELNGSIGFDVAQQISGTFGLVMGCVIFSAFLFLSPQKTGPITGLCFIILMSFYQYTVISRKINEVHKELERAFKS